MTRTTTLPSFGDLPAEYCDPARAAFAVIPVPYDATSTWKKGAHDGPAAILAASTQLELYDIETEIEVYREGIATLDPIHHDGDPESLADLVEEAAAACYAREQIPVVIGGEHSVSIGATRAAARHQENVSILQIDAHGDTRDSYEGSKFNHACVMARAREFAPCLHVGIRAIDAAELPGFEEDRVFWAYDIAAARRRGDSVWMDEVVDRLTDNVYVTIDLDAFDPSIIPATGTPEPGGLDWYDVTELLARVTFGRRVIGFDVVELLPTPGQWASEFLAAKLIYRFMSMIEAHRPESEE